MLTELESNRRNEDMKHYLGIDVSKEHVDVDCSGETFNYRNQQSGLEPLITKLKGMHKRDELKLVICEATGGYEQSLVSACQEAGLPVHVAHANKIRHFAKSKGLLAKTDKLDARVLSEYGRVFNPEAKPLYLSKNMEEIKDLLKRREQLQADKKREKNRLDKITKQQIAKSIKGHINWLDKEIKAIEQLLTTLEKSEDVKHKSCVIKVYPWARTLFCRLPVNELT